MGCAYDFRSVCSKIFANKFFFKYIPKSKMIFTVVVSNLLDFCRMNITVARAGQHAKHLLITTPWWLTEQFDFLNPSAQTQLDLPVPGGSG